MEVTPESLTVPLTKFKYCIEIRDIHLYTELWAFEASLIIFVTLTSNYLFCSERGKERVRDSQHELQ